jgi:hypothetical protein
MLSFRYDHHEQVKVINLYFVFTYLILEMLAQIYSFIVAESLGVFINLGPVLINVPFLHRDAS